MAPHTELSFCAASLPNLGSWPRNVNRKRTKLWADPFSGKIIIRRNYIGYLNYPIDLLHNQVGVVLYSTEKQIVEGNTIVVASTSPIQFYYFGQIKLFNNENASGNLLQGWTSQYLNELTTDLDLALSMLSTQK